MPRVEVGPPGRDEAPRYPLRLSAGGAPRRPAAPPARAPQPIPKEVMVLHHKGDTFIARHWHDADRARRDCRLCDKAICKVGPEGNCLVAIDGTVPRESAALWPKPVEGGLLALALALVPAARLRGEG